MNWPLSRLTTYVPSSPPAIASADLNAIQDAIAQLCSGMLVYGDGADGAWTQSSGVSIATANKNYTTMALSGTAWAEPNSHILRARQSIILTGTSSILMPGVAGANATAGAGGAGGAGGGAASQTLGAGGAGGAGGSTNTVSPVAGITGSAYNSSLGGAGGNGGAGTAVGTPGAIGGTAPLASQLNARNLIAYLTGLISGYNGSAYGAFPIGGGGGGGGGNGGGAGAGYGGGGGGGGGVIILASPVINIGAGCSINAAGGNGGNGYNGGGSGADGAGGGGGGGGVIILICNQLINNGTITVAGGTGGASSGSGALNGYVGAAGTLITNVISI